MILQTVMFYLFAVVAVASGVMVVSARNPAQNKVGVPAKAGIHFSAVSDADGWVLAFAGMTVEIGPGLGRSSARRWA